MYVYIYMLYVHVLILKIVDEITEYFGVKIGMYFAWLGHYTTALSIPAFFGFLFWVRNIVFYFEIINITCTICSCVVMASTKLSKMLDTYFFQYLMLFG